jgi:hypothetical protein
MSTKSRQVIFGSRIEGAKIRAENARERAKHAAREADRAEAEAWSIRMEGYGGPAQPSPTIGQCLNGGLGWLEVECNRCKTRASLPLDAIRRPRDTPIWKLEAALKCRSCRSPRYAPPVRMIKLTQQRELYALRLGPSGRREVSDKFCHALDEREREREQSKTGSGDCEEETVRNDLITHGAPITSMDIFGSRSICANASAECRRASYLKHRPIGLHLCDTGSRARGPFHRSPRRRLRGLG